MQKFNGVALRQFDSVGTGNVEPATQITVRNKSDNSLATIFSDNGVTSKANPTTTDARGRYSFYAANGTYIIEVGNPVLVIEDEVVLFDPNDETFGIPDAPQDSTAYARINGAWQRVSSQAGGGYPAKVGDMYASSSGPLDATKDLKMDGSYYSPNDYELGNTPGFPALTSPIDIYGTSFTVPASSNGTSISGNSLYYICSQTYATYGSVGAQIFYGNSASDFNYNNMSFIDSTDVFGTSGTFAHFGVAPYKEDQFIFFAGRDTSPATSTDPRNIRPYLLDPATGVVTPLDSGVFKTLPFCLGAAVSADGTVAYFGYGTTSGTTIRHNTPQNPTVFTEVDHGFNTNGLLPNLAFEINGTFFFCYSFQQFPDSDKELVIATSDFVTFTDASSDYFTYGIKHVLPVGDFLFGFSSFGSLVKSSDGITFDFEPSSVSTAYDEYNVVAGDKKMFSAVNGTIYMPDSFSGGFVFTPVSPIASSNPYSWNYSSVVSYDSLRSLMFIPDAVQSPNTLIHAVIVEPATGNFLVPSVNPVGGVGSWYVRAKP